MTSPWVHSTGTPPLAASSFTCTSKPSASDPSDKNSAVTIGSPQASASGRRVARQRSAPLDMSNDGLGRTDTGALWGPQGQRSGVEAGDEGSGLLQAPLGEGAKGVGPRPGVARPGVGMSHDIDRDGRVGLVPCGRLRPAGPVGARARLGHQCTVLKPTSEPTP